MINVPIDRIVPLTDARDNFSKIVAEIENQHDGLFILTKGGKPAIALININFLTELMKDDEGKSAPAPDFGKKSDEPTLPKPASTPADLPKPSYDASTKNTATQSTGSTDNAPKPLEKKPTPWPFIPPKTVAPNSASAPTQPSVTPAAAAPLPKLMADKPASSNSLPGEGINPTWLNNRPTSAPTPLTSSSPTPMPNSVTPTAPSVEKPLNSAPSLPPLPKPPMPVAPTPTPTAYSNPWPTAPKPPLPVTPAAPTAIPTPPPSSALPPLPKPPMPAPVSNATNLPPVPKTDTVAPFSPKPPLPVTPAAPTATPTPPPSSALPPLPKPPMPVAPLASAPVMPKVEVPPAPQPTSAAPSAPAPAVSPTAPAMPPPPSNSATIPFDAPPKEIKTDDEPTAAPSAQLENSAHSDNSTPDKPVEEKGIEDIQI